MQGIFILILVLIISIPIFIYKRRLAKNYKGNEIKWEWKLGILEKPLKYLYLVLSLIFLGVVTFYLYDYKGLIFRPEHVKGNIARIYCNKGVDCNPVRLVYVVSYKIYGENYTVNSSSSGVRTHFPSSLYYKNTVVGDSVSVLVSKEDGSKAIIEDDWSYFTYSLFALWVISMLLFVHSLYLIIKLGAK